MIKYSYIDCFRGDDIYIDVLATIPANAVTKIHLRQSAEADSYYILSIVDNKVYIPAEISSGLQGHYEFDIEIIVDGQTTTIQHTDLDIVPDVTRVYGDLAAVENSDLERKNIIADNYYIRNDDNSLTNINKSYRYTQNTPAEIWTITHNLNKRPSVTITDSAGTVVEGLVKYVNNNEITVEFSAGFSGYAELN